MQLNTTNFIRFYTGAVGDDPNTIPRLALLDNKVYCPVFVSGERAAFYCNATLPFLDGDDFSELELRILDADGTVASNLGVILQRVTLTNGYRFYADFIFPDLSNAQYQFQVLNTSTNLPKCVSNWFQTLDIDTADSITTYVAWRNSRSSYYYDFTLFPDFYCRLRLHLSAIVPNTPGGTVNQLQSVNNGRRRNLNRTVDLSHKIQTYYFDDEANLAAIALFEADTIEINGKRYLAKTIYNPNSRATSKVSTGEIELYEQDFSSVNKYGQLPVQLTNQGYIAFYNKTGSVFGLKAYNENGSLFQTTNVVAGDKKFFPIVNIPYGGRVDFVAVTPGSYDVLRSNVVDNVATFEEDTNSNPVSLSLGRVNVYNTDWTVVIS